MRQVNVAIIASQPPRYLRATLVTVVPVAVVPALFVIAAYREYTSSGWDPNGDSGAVQGFAFCFVPAAIAIVFSAVSFPIAAASLQRQGRFSKPQFFKLLRVWLAGLSVLVGLTVAGASGSLFMAIPVSLFVFCIVALLAFPFAHLWLNLAR
jgi:hypothetical protein